MRIICLLAVGVAVGTTVLPPWARSSSVAPPEIAEAESSRALTLGAFPHHSLLQLEAFYAPLAMYLSETLQRSVRFGTSSTYARFQERLRRRDFDIVFVDSVDYVRMAHPVGYTALVRRTNPTSVVFIVTPSSSLESLAELRGTIVAMPPQMTPEAGLGVERLRAVGLDPSRTVTVNYLPHHNACIQNVLAGRASACVTTTDALAFIGAEAGKDYRILDQAGTIPPALFAVAASMPQDRRDRLSASLIAWPGRSEREGGPANLEWFGLERVDDAYYDGLRQKLGQAAAHEDSPDAGVDRGGDAHANLHTGSPPGGH